MYRVYRKRRQNGSGLCDKIFKNVKSQNCKFRTYKTDSVACQNVVAHQQKTKREVDAMCCWTRSCCFHRRGRCRAQHGPSHGWSCRMTLKLPSNWSSHQTHWRAADAAVQHVQPNAVEWMLPKSWHLKIKKWLVFCVSLNKNKFSQALKFHNKIALFMLHSFFIFCSLYFCIFKRRKLRIFWKIINIIPAVITEIQIWNERTY